MVWLFATPLCLLVPIMGAQTPRLNVAAALAMSNVGPVEDVTKELVLLVREIEIATITKNAEAVCPILTVCGIPIRTLIASPKSSVISHIVAWLWALLLRQLPLPLLRVLEPLTNVV